MATLNERIEKLEAQIVNLQKENQSHLELLSKKTNISESRTGGAANSVNAGVVSRQAGFGMFGGGTIRWNNSELKTPSRFAEIPLPTKGYNWHSHDRYSGGALIADCLEVVQYEWGSITNTHSQDFYYPSKPAIKKTSGGIDMIGVLDLVFDEKSRKWTVKTSEIDVQNCNLVKRRTVALKDGNGDPIAGQDVGDIELDSKLQSMSSPLYNTDTTKTSVIWDENGNCWRFVAVYASGV